MTAPTSSAGPVAVGAGETPALPDSPLLPHDTAFFGHPRGLGTLFFAELWERFSYYGMRAILILFMTADVAQGGLGFPVSKAGVIYGTYTSMVYLMSVPGGWIADGFLGLRWAILLGGIVIMSGHICLAIPSLATFYLGLVLIVLGTGLLKPNISAIVGELYSPEDVRRDAGFSIYYMGINVGAFMAPLVVGWLAQSGQFKGTLLGMGIEPTTSWHFGFAAAAVGMFFGLIWYVAGWKHLGDAGAHPSPPVTPEAGIRRRRMLQLGLGGVAALIASLVVLDRSGIVTVTPEKIGDALGYVLVLTPLVLFPSLYFFGGFDRREKKHLIVIMVLFFGAAVFWSVFEQAGSTLNLFAARNTNSSITTAFAVCMSLIVALPALLAWRWMQSRERAGAAAVGFAGAVTALSAAGIYYLITHRGAVFPSSFFQSTNALFIVVLAPMFAALWTAWGERQPSSPAKFTVGILFAALGFGILIPATLLSAGGARVSPMWLVATYMLHTIGELSLSPVGLSAMTRLAPQRIIGLVLGIWFLAASLGNFMAGFAASFYQSLPLATLFATVTGVALLATVVMAASVGPIRRMLASR